MQFSSGRRSRYVCSWFTKVSRERGRFLIGWATGPEAFVGLSLFPSDGAAQVWKKFLDHAEPDIGAHRNAKAHGAISRGALAVRQPEPGEKSSCCYSAGLRNREPPASVIAASEQAAGKPVTHPRP